MILYLTEQGLKVSREGERLKLEIGHKKEEVRLAEVDQVVVFGRVSFTAPALQTLLKRGIQVHFLTLSGKYLGKLSTPFGKNIELRLHQFRTFHDPTRRIQLARAFVHGKIHNQREYLVRQKRRLGETSLEGPIFHLKRALTELPAAKNVEEIFGIEGMASRHYFEGLGTLLKRSGFEFRERTRRPPRDPVNALLSLGYTLLLSRIWSLVETAGLDPYLGFLHSPDYGKPSLVLDLMEEWRPVIVDTVVIRVLNWKTIKPEDFTQETFPDEEEPKEIQPVKLGRAGLKKFVKQFQERLKEEALYPPRGKRFRYADILREQVYLLARVLKGESPEYRPFMI
ncbi:CRISPR-associated endonuclease Cas1 [Thermosulfurimonas sp. F29]|uniref:CRISPR-associated endonuclease Cas1 n=1 Tax=Thermosulfurimonas sp. F29 TaxID=2867247 RepID=UPI001C82DA29|nr:CRISPR-associated endonuclease Cas1 [Thermosulfurimonas sp. F29]MBX6423224.1 CRISPR-associated endonuclease Cas1 [Thermosulfurimonas sp. F29]